MKEGKREGKKRILAFALAMLISFFVLLPYGGIRAQEPQELIEERTRISKTYWLGGDKYAIDAHIGSIHYRNDPDNPSEQWKEIDTNIQISGRANWDWEVTKGNWHLLVSDNTTVAVGKDGHWIGFRYEGFAYLDIETKEYVVLQEVLPVIPIVGGNTIRWEGLFYGVNLEYIYTNDSFKENLEITQTARDWLANNPPSSYGLSNQSTYLVGYVEVDWKQAYNAEGESGVAIDWGTTSEFEGESIYFRHPVKDYLVSALPVDWARHDDVEFENWVSIRKRFISKGGKNWLLFGSKVTELNQLPVGTIIFDPTVDEQVGASADDGCWSSSDFINTGAGFYAGGKTSKPFHGFMRFSSVTIPSGATINVAYLTLDFQTGNADVLAKISADDQLNPSAPVDEDDAGGRTLTTNQVDWDGQTATGWVDSPSIVDIVQELVDSYDYSSGSAMQFFSKDDGTQSNWTYYLCSQWDYETSLAPKLHIEYTVGGCSPNIDNSPISKEYGIVAENNTYETGLTNFTVTNNSGGAITITIQATDFTGGNGWTLSDTATPDVDTAGMKVGLEGEDYTIVVKKTGPYNILVTGLADTATQKWGLKLYTPTSHSDGVEKSSIVTLTATCD